ncbi:serine/threonine protein kinase [Clostridium sp. A1-XYC3]|uniref:Serine/threonine protein kinase n=1 Tax=Clostridium tanneri TaxID=3037988 RepID=A0ABU4JUC4_9CLOT|nr:serine/threonine protein kinase [Clostridium sp. A1-XYC3]MDW8801752.1 serine/threonine protein kinase [Clostridium sp. A1-XYC3]
MVKSDKNDYSNYYCGIDITKLKFIGQGTQGKVFFLPPDKVIKVFHSKHSCKNQLLILQNVSKSRFFTKVYDNDEFSIVMDFVPGITLKEYLNNNSLSEKLALELVELICEFEKLGFTRLDIRAPHIFVQADESIRIIDPRKTYTIVQKYPVKILSTLERAGVLEQFFRMIKDKYNDKYLQWKNLY